MMNMERQNKHLSLIKSILKSPIVMIIAGIILLLLAIYHFIHEFSYGSLGIASILLSVGSLGILEIVIGSTLIIQALMKLWFGEKKIKDIQFQKCYKVHKSGKFKYISKITLYFVIINFVIINFDMIERHNVTKVFEGLSIFNFIFIFLFACLCGFLLGMLYWDKSETRYQKYINENKD